METKEGIQSMREIMKIFNEMYKLPINDKPTIPDIKRLEHFISILKEEVKEGEDIIEKYKLFEAGITEEDKISLLADLSDWLGDIVWYIHSESLKYGIDLDKTIQIIKESNFSKLGKDGRPIYDERGKVMKGPDYFPPEEKIKELIKSHVEYNNN